MMKKTYILDGNQLLERQNAFTSLKQNLLLPDYSSDDCLTEFYQGDSFIIINADRMKDDSFSSKLLNVIIKASQQGGYNLLVLD